MKHYQAVKQQGFTLVELLVALLIGLAITLAAIGLLSSLFKTYKAVDDLAYRQEQITFTIESLIRNIRNAEWQFEVEDDEGFDSPPWCNPSSEADSGNNRLNLYIHKDRVEQSPPDDCDHYIYELDEGETSYALMEELDGEGQVELLAGLKQDGFRVCQHEDNEQQHIFQIAFCFEDASCSGSVSLPLCATEEHSDWHGWVRFYVVSRNLAILQIIKPLVED